MPRHLVRAGAVALAFGLVVLSGTVPAGAAASHAEITGSGSSWAANAVTQWIADVNKNGLQVVYTSAGSATGRQQFAEQSTDFGVSDIPYQGNDPQTGLQDTSLGRQYAYLPIVAGGTSFPYHLGNGASQIKNLRLSGKTLALIFTNQITNWDDPAIAADNNGQLKLPNLPIIPVVHAEGSGDTAQFTQYLQTVYPTIWDPYNKVASFTEYWPRKGAQVAQNGSDGVMNFVASGAGNGTIGYDEYSYPLLSGFPVAKLENAAGYFTAPTQYNVAVALTQAQINNDKTSINYLTQTLTNVYSYNDPRTYPLSSYSYAIIPTGNNTVEKHTGTTAKRQTIADFLTDAICTGQGEIGPIGYSALPVNLVEAGFDQIAKLGQADPGVVLSPKPVASCHNPTFDPTNLALNELAVIAPQPPACDKSGAGPCAAGVGLANSNPVNGQAPANSNSGATGGTGTATAGASASAGPSASASVDPVTGQIISTNPTAAGGSGEPAEGSATTLANAADTSGIDSALGVLAVILLLAVLVLPVLVNRYLASRRS